MSRLDTGKNWSQVGMDLTYFRGWHYLMLIDCGLSRFAIWRLLLYQDSACLICQLQTVLYERGPPAELLTNNGTVFCGVMFANFADFWIIWMRFCCTFVPSGNRIIEKSHSTIKRIAARSQCSIMKAVYWNNITLKDVTTALTAPANSIHMYQAYIKGINVAPPHEYTDPGINKLRDVVWIKTPHGWCSTQFKKRKVTGSDSPHSILINGGPCYISDLHLHWKMMAVISHRRVTQMHCCFLVQGHTIHLRNLRK